MDASTSEVPTSKDGQTDEDEPADTVRELAEAYARIEHVGELTDECAAEFETVKNAISVAQDRLFDAEVDRVREELTDGDGLEE